MDALAVAQAAVTRCQTEIARISKDKNASAAARRDAEESLMRAVKLVAALRGESDVTPQKILGSRYWRQLQDRLVAALEPFPGALDAAAEALEEFAESGG